MLIKLLDYNAKSKIVVVEIQGIKAEGVVLFLHKLQQMINVLGRRENKTDSTQAEVLQQKDVQQSNPPHATREEDHSNPESDTNSENINEETIRQMLDILRDEGE